jgi:hypothetical protein
MQRQTRQRPSARPLVVTEIESNTAATQNQVTEAIDSIIDGIVDSDAQLIANLLEATDPYRRLACVIGAVAKIAPQHKGSTGDLVEALDALRDALQPRAKYATQEQLNAAFARKTVTKDLGVWRKISG